MSEAAKTSASRPTATVRVGPELIDLLPVRRRQAAVCVQLDGTSSLIHIVESLGVPRTEIGALVVDGETAPSSFRPRGGETVVVHAVARPQTTPHEGFVLDVHLGALARRMRLVGVNTAYRNDADDDQLVRQAINEGRVLLTRDRGLLRRRSLPAGALVRGSRADDQLVDVLDRFRPPLAPWTRCPICNGLLRSVASKEIADQLEAGTLRSYHAFSRCNDCNQGYWRGAHADRLAALVEACTRAP